MMPDEPIKHPEAARLTREAFEATGVKTHEDFVALTHGAISLRSFRYWLAGARPLGGVEALVLRELARGWRPQAL